MTCPEIRRDSSTVRTVASAGRDAKGPLRASRSAEKGVTYMVSETGTTEVNP